MKSRRQQCDELDWEQVQLAQDGRKYFEQVVWRAHLVPQLICERHLHIQDLGTKLTSLQFGVGSTT